MFRSMKRSVSGIRNSTKPGPEAKMTSFFISWFRMELTALDREPSALATSLTECSPSPRDDSASA